MRPYLGGGTYLKPMGKIEELYSASRVYFNTARDGVNDVIIERAIHEGIKDLRIAKELSEDSDSALIASVEDTFRQLGYSEKRIKQVFAKGGSNPIEELIEKLLASDDINLRNKALQFTDVAAENVGSAAVRRSARAMGEILYYQHILGVDQKNLVGFDTFATNLKMAIGRGDTSDVYTTAKELLAGFDNAWNVSGVEDFEDLATDAKKRFFETINKIREQVDEVDEAIVEEKGKPYIALKELKKTLIQGFGKIEETSVFSLSEDLKEISDNIRGLQNSKRKLAESRAVVQSEIDQGILKSTAGDETGKFLENIIADSEKVKDLDEMDSLRSLVSSLSKKEQLSAASKIDEEDFAKLQNLFDLEVQHKPPTQLGKSEIAKYLEEANYAISDRLNKFKTEILGHLDTASKKSDFTVLDMIERLKVLYGETKIGPITAGLEESSRAKRVLASVIENLFTAQSRRN